MTLPYLGGAKPSGGLPNLARLTDNNSSFDEKIQKVLDWGVDGDNPIDNALWGTPEERERKKIEARHRDDNLMKIVQSGFGIRDTPEGKEVREAWKQGIKNNDLALEKTGQDLTHPFAKSSLQDIDDWVMSFRPDPNKSIGQKALGGVTGLIGLAKGLVEMPVVIAEQLLNSTVLPVDLSKENIEALTVDEISKAQKGTIANLAAAVAAPMVSKAMEAMHTGIAAYAATEGEALTLKGAGEVFAKKAQKLPVSVGKAATQKYGIGIIGRTMIDDVAAGATAGAAWGGIANANQEDMVENLMGGMMLGGIGLATGFFRGVSKSMERGRTYRGPEEVSHLAKDALMANGMAVTSETSIKNAVNSIRSVLKADNYAEAIMAGEVSVHRDSFVVLDDLQRVTTDQLKDNYAGLEVLIHERRDGTRSAMMIGPDMTISNVSRRRFELNGEPPREIGKQVVTHNGRTYYIDKAGTPFIEYVKEETGNIVPEVSYSGSTMKSGHKYETKEEVKRRVPIMKTEPGKFSVTMVKETKLVPVLRESVVLVNTHGIGMVEVPVSEVRVTTRAAQVIPAESVIKSMFNEFETKYPFQEGTAWRTNVKKFLTERGISEKTEAFSSEFARIMNEKYKGEALPANLEKFNQGKLLPIHQMLADASSNGMYIHEVGTRFEVRYMADSKKVFSSHSINSVRKYLKEMGQTKGEPLDAGLPVPSDAISVSAPAPVPTSISGDPFAVGHPEGSTTASRWVARFDAMHPAITAFRHFLDGHDVTYGINTGAIEKLARDAYNVSRERINGEMKSQDVQRFKEMVERLSEGKRDLLVARMETMHPDEIRTAYGMTQKAQQIAQEVITSGEDIHVIQKYKRIIEGIKDRHERLADEQAVAELKAMDKSNYTPAERDAKSLEIIKKFHEAALTKPEYLADVAQVNASIKPSPAFLKTYQDLLGYPDEQQAISRLADALGDRENNGLTQAEFDVKHGFKGNDVAAAKQMEMLYIKYAKEFGIQDHRMIPHYVNHYRQYGDVYEPNLEALQAGMANKGIRKFASEMVRTGEVVNYQRDPLQVVQAYIRSGVKGQKGGFYETMGELAEKMKKEMGKIPDDIAKEGLGRAWADFDAVLSGRNVLEADRANQIQQQYLRNKGMKPHEIADIMAQPSGLASVLALVNSSLMGARVSMGLRDGYTAISTYYMFNGMERTINFLKQSVDRNTMNRLKETGVISLPSYESIYETSAGQKGAFGKSSEITRAFADIGFKWSMQGHVNVLAQGAAYMETLKHSAPLIDKFLKKTITLEQLKKDVFFNSYDEHVKKSFETALVNEAGESAANVLALAQRDRIAGQFGVGSGTSGGSSTFGKLFNQMGSFSIQYRSTMMKAMSKGTPAEIGGVVSRHIISQSAMLAAAGVTGFNLSSWVIGPASLMFPGGPLLSVYQDVKSASDATLGGSAPQKEYAYRQLERAGLMFVPWGYSMRSMKMAYDLTQGSGYGVGRVLGQAAGVNVRKEEGYRSWFDMTTDTYPTLR